MDQVDASLPAEQIQVYIRDVSGGAYEVFQKSVMGDSKVTDAATQSASMTELATNIANNKWAIGYAGFGAYNKANANSTKLVAMKVDGVEATEANIVSGDCRIQRPVMFVGVGEPTDSEQAFIDYIYSDAGIKAIESNGYIPSFTAKWVLARTVYLWRNSPRRGAARTLCRIVWLRRSRLRASPRLRRCLSPWRCKVGPSSPRWSLSGILAQQLNWMPSIRHGRPSFGIEL